MYYVQLKLKNIFFYKATTILKHFSQLKRAVKKFFFPSIGAYFLKRIDYVPVNNMQSVFEVQLFE